MDWLAIFTIATALIGALVELLYKPARQRDVDQLRREVEAHVEQLRNEARSQTDGFFDEAREIREEMRVRLAVLEARKPPAP